MCCTVFGDLVTTLNNLYHAREDGEIPRFDHVVIETSGLADPSPLYQAFLSDPTLAGLYRIGTVVATVDAVNGPDTLDKHIGSVHQGALADHILITKLDCIDAAEAKEAEATLTARLRRLNPAAGISCIDGPAFEIGALLRTFDIDPAEPKGDVRAWLNAAAYEQHVEIAPTARITATAITTITTACTTATSHRSVLCVKRRSHARRSVAPRRPTAKPRS